MSLEWLLSLDPRWLHTLLFALLLAEGIGTPGIPFTPVFLAEGLAVSLGEANLYEAMVWGAAGNWIGNLIGYQVGRRGVKLLPQKLRERVGLKQVSALIARWGGSLVFISRWFGPIRTPFILYAGAAGMSFGLYAGLSLISAAIWVSAWQYGLWRFGEVLLDLYNRYEKYVIVGGLAVLAATLLGWWLWSRRQATAR